ncbi:MAG: hypothetical protein AAGA54_09565 [Myxococcota bacterium]
MQTSTSGTSSVDASSTSADAETSTGVDGPPDHVPPGFLNPTDAGSSNVACSTWLEDCPAGEKCMPYANDGGNAWNATRCVPVASEPDAVGESCTVEESGVSGFDSCEQHAMCWNIDRDTNVGTCRAFCIGNPSNPSCAQAGHACLSSADGFTPLCIPQCDPLQQDCGPQLACYPVEYGYTCAPDASGPELGSDLSPCEFINACDAGLICAGLEVCGPESSSCCTPYCDLTNPDCPDGRLCQPIFESLDVPLGTEDVGFCGDPS